MQFIETSIFTKSIAKLLSDDEYKELQISLAIRPEAGAIIKSTGGLRKLRWKQKGRGKRGGLRIIYYFVTAEDEIYMLYIYRKTEREDLSTEQKRILKQLVKDWIDE